MNPSGGVLPGPIDGIATQLLDRIAPEVLRHSEWRATLRILSEPRLVHRVGDFINRRGIDWEQMMLSGWSSGEAALLELARAIYLWDWRTITLIDPWLALDPVSFQFVQEAMEIGYCGRGYDKEALASIIGQLEERGEELDR